MKGAPEAEVDQEKTSNGPQEDESTLQLQSLDVSKDKPDESAASLADLPSTEPFADASSIKSDSKDSTPEKPPRKAPPQTIVINETKSINEEEIDVQELLVLSK